jgi:hypothetical protein
MMGEQARSESLFYYFRLEEQIPEDHLLRRSDILDMSCNPHGNNWFQQLGKPQSTRQGLLPHSHSKRHCSPASFRTKAFWGCCLLNGCRA